MNAIPLLAITALACLASANVSAAGGPRSADKVTGEYTYGSCFDCVPGDELTNVAHSLLSAHEATGKSPQKGFQLSWRDDGLWFEIDLRDTENSCVVVWADGRARIGGLVSDGNGPQVGKYFGSLIMDEGEPAYFNDRKVTYRFPPTGREDFLAWCLDGEPDGATAIWPQVVIQGNIQVHNSPGDGD
jgi:hypothetical protein